MTDLIYYFKIVCKRTWLLILINKRVSDFFFYNIIIGTWYITITYTITFDFNKLLLSSSISATSCYSRNPYSASKNWNLSLYLALSSLAVLNSFLLIQRLLTLASLFWSSEYLFQQGPSGFNLKSCLATIKS